MIKIKMLSEKGFMPKRATIESAGNDIFATENIRIKPKEIAEINLPFIFEGELEDYEATIYVRSSFGMKKKQRIVDGEGNKYISGYRLPLRASSYTIGLLNDAEEEIEIQKGEHFAQIVITKKDSPFEKQEIEWLTEKELPNGKVMGRIEMVKPNVYDFVIEQDIVFNPNEQKTISTGLRSVIESGTYTAIDVHEDVKENIMLGNQRGIVDCDYAYNESTHGNCFLGLLNVKNEELVIKKNTRIVRLFTEKYEKINSEETVTTVRTGGVGHTSK